MLVTYDLKLEEFTVVSYRCQLQMLVTDVSHICFSHMLVTEYKLSRTQKKLKIVTNRQFCLTSNQLSYLSQRIMEGQVTYDYDHYLPKPHDSGKKSYT